MTIERKTITPHQAAELLLLNSDNRRLRPHVVRRYADHMTRGEWKFTGESIVLLVDAISGVVMAVLNGQHRLHACVLSGCAFETVIVRTVDPTVYDVIDSGLGRQAGDVLQRYGHANFNVVAAATRLVLGYRSNTLTDTNRLQIEASRTRQRDEADLNRELYGTFVALGVRAKKEGFNPSGLAAFGVLLTEQLAGTLAAGPSPEILSAAQVAEPWVRSVLSGADMAEGDPRLALRRWVMAQRKANNAVHLSAWIRTRNAFVRGESRAQIKSWFAGTPFPQLGDAP
jgi:hypothetical protein